MTSSQSKFDESLDYIFGKNEISIKNHETNESFKRLSISGRSIFNYNVGKDIQMIINKILTFIPLSKSEIFSVLSLSVPIFSSEPSLIKIHSPITVCGDIHGQLRDLIEIFRISGEPPENSYLFMGDYVDRGNNSVECFTLLVTLKIIFPQRIYLLRGNHESASVTKIYGFYDECIRKYDSATWLEFNKIFAILL